MTIKNENENNSADLDVIFNNELRDIDINSIMFNDDNISIDNQLYNTNDDTLLTINKNNVQEPVLYILMRNDLQSLNAGKAIAQGAHAAQSFINTFNEVKKEYPRISNYGDILNSLFQDWVGETDQLYGTTIVLQVNENELSDIIGNITYITNGTSSSTTTSDIINDPTYPFIVENKEIAKVLSDNNDEIKIISILENGKVMMTRPENTCAYIFCDKNNEQVKSILENIELY